MNHLMFYKWKGLRRNNWHNIWFLCYNKTFGMITDWQAGCNNRSCLFYDWQYMYSLFIYMCIYPRRIKIMPLLSYYNLIFWYVFLGQNPSFLFFFFFSFSTYYIYLIFKYYFIYFPSFFFFIFFRYTFLFFSFRTYTILEI